jgi:CheY-like chemotaxis protein
MSARILVVDDDSITREIHRALLEHLGYDVLEAPDGAAALALLQQERVDLLATGIYQGPPGLDGIELARLARQQHPGLRVLFISGNLHLARDRLEPRDRDRSLTKPFLLQQLAESVADALEESGDLKG